MHFVPARRALLAAVRAAEERLRRRARGDPEAFARRYLPHYLRVEPAGFHRYLYRCMAGEELAGAAQTGAGRCLAFAAPRGHAKSTLVTLIFVLWSLCTRRKRCILLVSDTEAQAEMFLADLRAELEHNDLLRADFGELLGPVWRQDQILCASGARVVARGTGSALRGLRSRSARPDLIVADDLENDGHVSSSELRRKVWHWFTTALMNALDPEGEIWVIGTILHHDSLLANLVGGNAERGIAPWPGRVWQALDAEGRALWPALWSAERLAARRRLIGSIAFAQEFLNQPASAAGNLFRSEWLDAPEAWYEVLPAGLDFYQAVDPAIARGDDADYFCLVTIGRAAGCGDLYVADIVRGRFRFEEQVALILAQAARWQPVQIGIEAVAYQQGLADALLAHAALPVVAVRAPADKFTRAQRLSALMENAKIKLRRGDPRMYALRDELLQFPHGAHDDQVDALGYAASLAALPGAQVAIL